MSASILVEYRKVYGAVRIYPINLAAEQLAQAVGTKTFTERQLVLFESVGIDVQRRSECLRSAA